MRLTVLAPSPGSAPFVTAMVGAVLDGLDGTATVVVGTGDDVTSLGLRLCRTTDAVVDALTGRGTGGGRVVQTGLEDLGLPGWPTILDADLATHLARSAWLARGSTPSEVLRRTTSARGLPPGVTVLPMSDVPVETHVVLDLPDDDSPQSAVHVRQWAEELGGVPVPSRVVVAGLDAAPPAPGVLDAVRGADVVVIGIGDPVLQVGPMLGVPGLRDALRGTEATVVVLDPTTGEGGAPGLGVAGLPETGPGAARLFRDIADVWLTGPGPEGGRGEGYPTGMRVVEATSTDPDELAQVVLASI